MIQSMLTTTDNPFSPFDEFEAWFACDTRLGYHTLPLLARVVVTSDELPLIDQHNDIDRAIDDIINLQILPNYIKVQKEFKDEDLIVSE